MLNKTITCAVFLSVVVPVSLWGYSGGEGTPEDPYQIATAADLIALGDEPNDYDKHFVLTADVDLSGRIFERAVIAQSKEYNLYGFVGVPFSGSFDGKGHVIQNLHIKGERYLGLFGCLASGSLVVHLGLENVDVNGTSKGVGGLVGHNDGMVLASYSTGKVSGILGVGGLVGYNNGVILSSYSDTKVHGKRSIGGLVGQNVRGYVLSSYCIGPVSGEEQVGGLVGMSWYGYLVSVYSTGSVSGTESVGGLVGQKLTTLVGASFWNNQTSGLSDSRGGQGLTTPQMLDLNTYLDVGWDFIGEGVNGTCNFWLFEEGTYPKLAVFSGRGPGKCEGEGIPELPYLIKDANDLGAVWFRPQAYYRLVEDINLVGMTWRMAVVPWFGGYFEGDRFHIRSLFVEGLGTLGLFGIVGERAVIRNVELEDVYIYGGDYVGGLVGINYGSISSSCVRGAVRGMDQVGGLAGMNNGEISLCCSTGTVSGWGDDIGGLVGLHKSNFIQSSYSIVTVTGEDSVGGLVGTNELGSIFSSYSICNVIGDRYVGGIVGSSVHGAVDPPRKVRASSKFNKNNNRPDHIRHCFSRGVVKAGRSVGGLIGINTLGRISSCYSACSVSGEHYAGGLIGSNSAGRVLSSFWDSEISGTPESDGGTSLGTSQMQDIQTYLNAGWSIVNEITDNTNGWFMRDNDYPILIYEGVRSVILKGMGIQTAPYIIRDANELETMSYYPPACFCMVSDIDLSGVVYDRAVIPRFEGIFNGNGYCIRSLNVQGENYLGLFDILESGVEISNLELKGVSVKGTGDYVGSLAGQIKGGTITKVHCTGSVMGSDCVGGLVGYVGKNGDAENSIISSSSYRGTVIGMNYVGGIVGENTNGLISFCCSEGDINGENNVGGLVGYNDERILSSYNTANVHGVKYIGGLAGWSGFTEMSYSTGSVSGDEYVGGLLGGIYGRSRHVCSSSFWDTQTSGMVESLAGTGLTTNQMQDINTYLNAGWDFENTWLICEGDYPRLQWEYVQCDSTAVGL